MGLITSPESPEHSEEICTTRLDMLRVSGVVQLNRGIIFLETKGGQDGEHIPILFCFRKIVFSTR